MKGSKTISLMNFFTLLALMTMIGTASGVTVWEKGYDVVLRPDELATAGKFTIKAIDFPSPVTGHRTVNDTIVPDYPVNPFVTLELYYDMANNSSPITKFSLTQGDSYESDDEEIKIILKSMSDPLSSKWVYQFYDPKAVITIQLRARPSLDIDINIEKKGDIYGGDPIRISTNIKNTGDDKIENLNIEINSSPELTIYEELSIGNLNKDNNYTKEFVINAPMSLDDKDYFINMSVTGMDIKGVSYIWNKSSVFNVKNRDIKIYKNVRTTFYLKDSIYVVISISNPGSYKIENIRINDTIADKLKILDNNKLSDNRSIDWNIPKIDPVSSLTVEYSLKALEPGPYVLPETIVNYTINGLEYTSSSEEIGLRIFGPKIILKKSIDISNISDDGSGMFGILNIKISARNVGNTFTKVDIFDNLPPNMTYEIISGSLNSTISLYPDIEKMVIYSIKTNSINVNTTAWPPAKAIYYIDAFKFETSSNEKELEISKTVPIQSMTTTQVPQSVLQNGSAEHTPNVTTSSPKVVATLPRKVPIQVLEKKSSPGFGLYDVLVGILLIIILNILGRLRRN